MRREPEQKTVRHTDKDMAKSPKPMEKGKLSAPKDPEKVKGDGIKAAQGPRGAKPDKVTSMKAAKKDVR